MVNGVNNDKQHNVTRLKLLSGITALVARGCILAVSLIYIYKLFRLLR